ncbi:hypothetical protein F5X97DRAFT_323743 [Nemania serpens]|nr:hypothetical protein F5X97DRAFT_323743 [Nemania serpens]
MEFATRTYAGSYICGLKRCIQMDAKMEWWEKYRWCMAKKKGLELFAPELGGSYEVFDERPLPKKIRVYCVQDVHFLPRLWDLYNEKLTDEWRTMVEDATKDRVLESQAEDYDPDGPNKTLPPDGW